MNKIVCDLCGTTYPDTANQCPICGTARTAEVSGTSDQNNEAQATGGYTYVKGGHFSKKNVKKRTETKSNLSYRDVEPEKPKRQPAPAKKSVATQKPEPTKQKNKDKVSVGLTIVAIVLVVAIIAVLGYIVVRFFLPADFFGGSNDTPPVTDPPAVSDPLPELVGCETVTFQENVLSFTEINATQKLNVTLAPADTTDSLRFASSDETVAVVSDDGTVTAVGEGTAIITAYCGSASTQCTVTCSVTPTVNLELNRKEITFEIEGQTWVLYDGDLDVTAITWVSDNEAVATVANGTVTAVAEGDAMITATYGDQNVQCAIHCVFEDEQETDTPTVTEPVTEPKTYKLVNGYGGSNKDVTMTKGSSFPLKLVDQDGKTVSDAVWSVDNKNVCSYSNGWVKAKASGMTKVKATIDGNTYTCIIRVS